MIITTKLSIDMQNNVPRPVISAVQNDSNSRAIEFLFYSGCTPWTIPDGITAALSYSKPDGTAGIYDKLPDGAEAFSISGTAISAIMAPQMLTVPGEVKAAIVLSDANSTQLSTFPFIVNVVASPNPGKIVSENYCYYTNLDAINEAINALQQAGGGSSYPTTTEITEESTDKQVPTAKAVYDYVTQNSSGSDSGGNVDLTGYATEQYVQDYAQPKGNYLTAVPEGYAKTEDIPKKPEDIGAQPSGNYALKSEIPSVPVQSVNGKTGAVNLSASDVKARPDNWMPTAQEVGALPNTYTPPNQTAEQVGADPKGTATSAVSQHNTADDSHGDIRLELKVINDRLTAFFDSDNQTLDELSEIVAYITSNKSLIDSITTSKVSVADIVNNLTSNVTNKPLSAAQGVVLKGLIDAVSNSLANYQPKGNYLTEETDPTVPAWAKQSTKPSYSKSEVGLGNVDNVKQYSASNPPPYPVTSVNGKTGAVSLTIPTVPTKVSAFTNDAGYLTEHQDISGKANKTGLTLGIHTDGLVYLFVDGVPTGTGIEMGSGGDVVGYVDENNNIILSGALAEGEYTVKYELEDGTLLDIGELSTVSGPKYTNLAGTIVAGRLGSDGTVRSDAPNSRVTDFVAVKNGDVVRVKGMAFEGTTYPSCTYNSSKAKLSSGHLNAGNTAYFTVQSTTTTGAQITIISNDVGFVRFSGIPTGADEDIIVTVNEEID